MSFMSGKKFLLLGFLVVLLIAVPVTVYLIGQQQQTTSSTQKATIVSLSPSTKNITADSTVTFDVNVDPSNVNLVSFVKLYITYDPNKLATTSSSLKVSPWTTADGSTFTPTVLSGPIYKKGVMSITISGGSNPKNTISKPTKVATVALKALELTQPGAPTNVKFGNETEILSTSATTGSSVNVLSSSTGANVNIAQAAVTVTPTPTPTPTLIPTSTLTPTPTSTTSPTLTLTPTPTSSTSSQTSQVSGLICSSLTVDPSTVGTVPYTANLTVIGTSTDSTISKVSFDFGDGEVQEVTESGGIGTSSVSVLTTHIYSISGTFNATATLTDANGNTSFEDCTTTIVVSDTGATSTLTPIPSPLAPTGPTGVVAIGVIGILLTVIGAIILLAL